MPTRKLARSAADFLPARRTLPALREAARGCRGCDLYENATQTVFGEVELAQARKSSPTSSVKLVFVGEQPGDKEDIDGRPFVGPAGGVLDRALGAAGIEREAAYVTNIVKHFKFEQRGKRRIHKKPNALEIAACTPWFENEVACSSLSSSSAWARRPRRRCWERSFASPKTADASSIAPPSKKPATSSRLPSTLR